MDYLLTVRKLNKWLSAKGTAQRYVLGISKSIGWKLNYQSSVVTDKGKRDTEMQRRIEIAKDVLQKLSKALRERKISV